MTENNAQAPVNQTIFEFEGKTTDVQTIPIENLERSIRREAGLAGIRSVPIQFWRMYSLISGMIEKSELNYNEGDIWVQNNSSKAYLTDEEKNEGFTQKRAPLNRWRFDKILTTIQLPNIIEGDNEGIADTRNGAVGLTLNKEGLVVSFGMNVHACKNFNVMGGTIMKSYGDRGRDATPWDVMEVRLHKWFENFTQFWTVQNEIMTAMKARTFDPQIRSVEEVVGDLYFGAVKQAYFKGDAVPFNINQLSDFVQESIRQRKDEEQIANIWDLYNWGTGIMKPGRVDIGDISDNSNMWSDYLIDRFELNVTKNIPEYVLTEETE